MSNRLWAPWRSAYVSKPKSRGCVFCRISRENNDKKNHIIARSEYCFTVLNTFPYNNGHLMVIPFRHIASPVKLSAKEYTDMVESLNKMIVLYEKILHPHGFNIGMNIGSAAGAGIAQHLHMHLVPRWKGDVNFMPVIAETKVIPQGLDELYQLLTKKKHHEKI